MERKQILILTLALVVLFASIFFVARGIKENKSLENTSTKKLTVEQEKARTAMLSGAGKTKEDAKPAIDIVLGSVDAINKKTLTMKHLQESATVNVNDATPVMIVTEGKEEAAIGKITDIKVGDAVKVTYDKATMDTKLISLTRLSALEKK